MLATLENNPAHLKSSGGLPHDPTVLLVLHAHEMKYPLGQKKVSRKKLHAAGAVRSAQNARDRKPCRKRPEWLWMPEALGASGSGGCELGFLLLFV